MSLARTTHGVTFDPNDPSTVPPPWAVPAPPAPPPVAVDAETIAEAALRTGVSKSVLYSRAKSRGVVKRGSPVGRRPKGQEVRLSPEEWDSLAEPYSKEEKAERRAEAGVCRHAGPRTILRILARAPWTSRSDVVIAAWKECPRVFGLRGYESKHPCSHSVVWRVENLIWRGLVKSQGGERYGLTTAGRATVEPYL